MILSWKWMSCVALSAVVIPMATHAAQPTVSGGAPLVQPTVSAIPGSIVDTHRQMAMHDPARLFETALARYDQTIDDYTAVFSIQEKLGRTLTPQREIVVKFKDEPFSLAMHWIRNPDRARRMIYVQGLHRDSRGRKQCLVQPEGALARLLVPTIKIRLDSDEARETSRQGIEQFGFKRLLEMIVSVNARAADRGELTLKYTGTSVIDDRATYTFERLLPYDSEHPYDPENPQGAYPERKQIIHLDQQWLLPLACFCYADDQGRDLLGSYIYRDVKLNTGLTEQDFTPAANGM